VLPDGEHWIQAFGNHVPRSRSGYSTNDRHYVPADTKPDATWNFFELHPVVVTHYFLIYGTRLPLELEKYQDLAGGPAYTEWLSRQDPGFPGVGRDRLPGRRHSIGAKLSRRFYIPIRAAPCSHKVLLSTFRGSDIRVQVEVTE
jgi:hypothetical protein